MGFSSKELALAAAEAAAEKKARDIVILDMEKLSPITDYFVIASGTNKIQIQAIAEEIEDNLQDLGIQPLRKEGYREGSWILLDYANIVVHVFLEEERKYYDLERLWRDAPRLVYGENTPLSLS